MNERKPSDDNRKKWTTYLGIPFQMLATIFLGYIAGNFLDKEFDVKGLWFTIGLTLLAVLISLYQLIAQVRKPDNQDR